MWPESRLVGSGASVTRLHFLSHKLLPRRKVSWLHLHLHIHEIQVAYCCHRANLNVHPQSYLFTSPRFLPARRVSSFTTCFVNTPRQENLIPSLINSRMTFSPSWLMAVMCFNSITSSRPLRSALASSLRIPQLGCPGRNELPFQNQPTLGATINEGDPQHAVFLTHVTKAMGVPNQKARKVMNLQSGVGRSWLLKVNVVQNTIEQRHLVRSGELRSMVKGKLLVAVKTAEYSFAIEAGSAPVIQALSWLIRNIARDRCPTFLDGHRVLCD